MDNIAVVVGTRPEIIKMAPIILKLQKKKKDFNFILTGQHYDYNLSKQFVEELNLPIPNASFKLINSTPASQIGEMMSKLEIILAEKRPLLLLIQGDTNTMLAAALTAIKLKIPVGHVEAGLRSYDWRMPEEHNRRMVDHISDILFTPTEHTKNNLLKEYIHGKTYVTGNTIIDAIYKYLPLANKKSKILNDILFNEYAVVTAHRAENVDNPLILKEFVKAFLNFPIPIVFPLHPRTRKRLIYYNLYHTLEKSENILILPPLSYFDMLSLIERCNLIATDSGGLQEEATSPLIQKPVIVLRISTERPEAVKAGFATIVGVQEQSILQAVNKILDNPPILPNVSPFGDGKSSERIVNIILQDINNFILNSRIR